jgi:predicted transcriptional regulator
MQKTLKKKKLTQTEAAEMLGLTQTQGFESAGRCPD